jgi:predicted HAD superfamily Cof-like phosphohydrolase
MSNFDKVKEFHKLFEHVINTEKQSKIFDTDPKLVNLRLKLIKEEYDELVEGVKNKDITEVADALTDLLYVIYGAGHTLGINLDKCFDIVHDSNMTKACNTIDEAIESIEHIKSNYLQYINPQYKLSNDGKYFIIYNGIDGKILKSKYYKEADLKNI